MPWNECSVFDARAWNEDTRTRKESSVKLQRRVAFKGEGSLAHSRVIPIQFPKLTQVGTKPRDSVALDTEASQGHDLSSTSKCRTVSNPSPRKLECELNLPRRGRRRRQLPRTRVSCTIRTKNLRVRQIRRLEIRVIGEVEDFYPKLRYEAF
jgi:hypothetical protein